MDALYYYSVTIYNESRENILYILSWAFTVTASTRTNDLRSREMNPERQ